MVKNRVQINSGPWVGGWGLTLSLPACVYVEGTPSGTFPVAWIGNTGELRLAYEWKGLLLTLSDMVECSLERSAGRTQV